MIQRKFNKYLLCFFILNMFDLYYMEKAKGVLQMDQNKLEEDITEDEKNPYNTRENDLNEHSVESTGNPSVFGIITTPREQFEKIIHQPKFLIAILIVTLFTFIGALLTLFNFTLPADIIAELGGGEEAELVLLISKVTLIIAGIVGPIFGILLSTAIYFIIVKILKSEITFKQTFSMFSHISIISAIGALFQGIIMLVVPNLPADTVVTSLGSLVDAGPMLNAVLNSIELFSIWQLIVTAIGLQIVAKLSKRVSWTIVIVVFIIGLVLQMVSAAMTMITAI